MTLPRAPACAERDLTRMPARFHTDLSRASPRPVETGLRSIGRRVTPGLDKTKPEGHLRRQLCCLHREVVATTPGPSYARVPSARPTHTTWPTRASGSVAALTAKVRVGYADLSEWSALTMSVRPLSSTRCKVPPSCPVRRPVLRAQSVSDLSWVGAARARSTGHGVRAGRMAVPVAGDEVENMRHPL